MRLVVYCNIMITRYDCGAIRTIEGNGVVSYFRKDGTPLMRTMDCKSCYLNIGFDEYGFVDGFVLRQRGGGLSLIANKVNGWYASLQDNRGRYLIRKTPMPYNQIKALINYLR